MKAKAPAAFSKSFTGPEGRYTVHFHPTDTSDGTVDVTIGGVAMQWHVMNVELKEDGSLVLGGLTHGSKAIWNDVFWFSLHPNDTPATIQYWGDRVIWREDKAAS
mgnify:CR=1